MTEQDPTRRAFLEAELAEVETQMANLAGTASYLRQRLGLPDVASSGNGNAEAAPLIPLTGDLMAMVNPGQFGGMSANKAASDLLRRVGRDRPLSTREIYDAITKGGVTIKDTDVLAKMMKRSGRFHRPVRGRWGLAEWYPASVRAKAAGVGLQEDDDEPDLPDPDANAEGEGGDAEG